MDKYFGLIGLVISLVSLTLSLLAFRFTRYRNRLHVLAKPEQDLSRKNMWQIKMQVSNTGWRPLSITKIEIDNKAVSLSGNEKLPLRLEPADVKGIEFRSDYYTEDKTIYIYDHTNKRHETVIPRMPPLTDQ